MTRKPNPSAVLALAKRPDGTTLDELTFLTGCEVSDLETVCAALLSEGGLIRRGSIYYTPAPKPEITMSPFARQILSDLRTAGNTGIEAGRSKIAGTADILAQFRARNLAVELEGGIYLSREIYDESVRQIVKGLSPGERFTVSAAKEKTGLSRKYLIPLLEQMERDGFSKRQNEFHIVMFRKKQETPVDD